MKYYLSKNWIIKIPRIQVLRIEELLTSAEVKLPPSSSGAFKKAGKVNDEEPKQGELDL